MALELFELYITEQRVQKDCFFIVIQEGWLQIALGYVKAIVHRLFSTQILSAD
ncbi:MAG: hypothetical protein PUB42_07305 [Firmicutes bacterium]|nr:hypothetical protein [Bacillota bacterium]